MKTLIIIIFVTFGILIAGCDDPLGYDPDVIVVPDGDLEDIGDITPLAIDAKEVRINFIEVVKSRDVREIPCIWKKQDIRVKLDTSGDYIKMWFEGNFSEKEKQNNSNEGNEGIYELRMQFGALLNREIVELNQNMGSRKWVMARLQNKGGRFNSTIFGWQTQAWILINKIDRINNTIDASFLMKISSPGKYYQTDFIKATINIKY